MIDTLVGKQPLESDAYDTINTAVVPIVFVPGVMGSRLDIPGGSDWDPDYQPSMAGWLACSTRAGRKDLSVTNKPNVTVIKKLSDYTMGEDAQGEIKGDKELVSVAASFDSDDAVALYEERGWGGVAWGFYGPILTYLEKRFNHPKYQPSGRHPVYAYGYDWRKSNAVSADGLVARVKAIKKDDWPDAKKVVIVTHSMGGLVARYACVKRGLSDLVLGVVHTVLPSNGAIAAYRRFFTGCVKAYDNDGDWKLNTVLGDAWWKYAAYMSGLPGPMQLMPNQRYAETREVEVFPLSTPDWLITKPQVDLAKIYEVYRGETPPGIVRPESEFPLVGYQIADISMIWDTEIVPGLRARISEAEAFHNELADGAHRHTWVYFSTGLKTDEKVDWTAPEGSRFIQAETGDGTVPSLSAVCPGMQGVRSRFMGADAAHGGIVPNAGSGGATNLGHSEVFKNAMVRTTVRDFIQSVLTWKD
jgi:pimeloyl-ACP methyl ester carboxylesterase